ncbi:transmembrane protein 216-like [Halichondria panicea]|uniref:transmembrane protein 216-like n=1 Tax=Halichondria panicea TaxID=6063 RepID=UPI00312B8E67
MANSKRISSLPLQVVLYFNGWFLVLFYIAEMALLIYKATTSASYPPGNLAAEVILLLILCLLDIIRIYYGAKGNLTERKLPLLLSLLFVPPLVGGYLYLTVWQTTIHRLEYVLLALGYTGLLLELVIGAITLIVFQRSELLG